MNKGLVTMTIKAEEVKELESLCSDKLTPFPRNAILEIQRLKLLLKEVESKYINI